MRFIAMAHYNAFVLLRSDCASNCTYVSGRPLLCAFESHAASQCRRFIRPLVVRVGQTLAHVEK
jgi:Fe-S-cluster containining protein